MSENEMGYRGTKSKFNLKLNFDFTNILKLFG
jgi:hypothetical protein